MKVVLVRPPFIDNKTGPPIGLAYISAELKKAGHDVIIVDLNIELNNKFPNSIVYNRDFEIVDHNKVYHHAYDQMGSYCKLILGFNPDIVGFYLSYPTFKYAISMAKQLNKYVRCIAGGPSASYNEEKLLRLRVFDTVVSGYGEEGILEAINTRGIIKKDLIKSKKYLPDYSQIDIDDYNGLLPIITTRGCPNICTFCTQNYPYIYHDIDSVVDQISANNNIKTVMYNDSNLNVDGDRTMRLFSALATLRNRPYGHIFGLQIRKDFKKYVNLMAMAGIKEARVGIESGSLRERNSMKKPYVSNEMIIEFVKELADNKINVMAQYIFCYPDQTEEDRFMTRDLINSINNVAGSEYVTHYIYKYVVHHGTEKYFKDKYDVTSITPQNWSNDMYNPEKIINIADEYRVLLPSNCNIFL